MTDVVAADPTPAADPAPADPAVAPDATLITDPPADPADPPADPAADPADPADPPADPEAEVEGAPEAYTDFTMPEGIELDGDIANELKTTAKELNLTQEQAQRVAELGAKMRQRDVEAIVALRQSWVEATKTDKEIGGDKFDATLATAKRGLDAYGSPQFRELLIQSGLGNHPEVIRTFANVGKTLAEDKVVSGGDSTTTPQGSLAKRLFAKDKE